VIEFSSRTRSKLLVVHDLREPLPLEDAAADVVFAHMALCMALSTKEIHAVADEVRRVLRPGGVFIYTVRHTGDAHYGPVTRTVTTCSSTVVSPCTSFRDNSSMLWPTAGYSMTCTLSRRAICLGGYGKSPPPNPPQKGGTTRSAAIVRATRS